MKMTRRITPKKETSVAVIEEPQTSVCEDVPTVIEKREIARCNECYLEVWRGELCFTHWKQSQGLVFNEETKTFVKARKKCGTHAS